MDIIQKQLWPMFGQQIIYFDHPVEVNIVPDYYKVCLRLSQKACWQACWVACGTAFKNACWNACYGRAFRTLCTYLLANYTSHLPIPAASTCHHAALGCKPMPDCDAQVWSFHSAGHSEGERAGPGQHEDEAAAAPLQVAAAVLRREPASHPAAALIPISVYFTVQFCIVHYCNAMPQGLAGRRSSCSSETEAVLSCKYCRTCTCSSTTSCCTTGRVATSES